VHSKKRNRLEHQRLNDIVYVHYNLRLRQRYLFSSSLHSQLSASLFYNLKMIWSIGLKLAQLAASLFCNLKIILAVGSNLTLGLLVTVKY